MDAETTLSGSGGDMTNSALRESKRMYEDMARVIQLGERPQPIDTIGLPHETATHELTEHKSSLPQPDPMEKENMQEELKAFMDNMM